MIAITPKSKIGKWSVWLMVAMPILFILGSLTVSMYQSVPASDTILEDLKARPFLAISMLAAMLCGISAFVTGLMAIIKEKERALLIYFSVGIGALLIFFLLGEFMTPH